MLSTSKSTLTLLGAVSLLGLVLLGGYQVTSQDAPPEGGGRRQFDPAAMRQRILEGYRERLGSSEEEWKVLSPKLEAVMKLQTDNRSGGGGFFGGGGRGGPGGGRGGPGGGRGGDRATDDPNASPSTKARRDLRTALEDKATSTEDISKKLDTYRKARDEARDAIAKAQKDLRELLTKRQEAQLVVDGMLD